MIDGTVLNALGDLAISPLLNCSFWFQSYHGGGHVATASPITTPTSNVGAHGSGGAGGGGGGGSSGGGGGGGSGGGGGGSGGSGGGGGGGYSAASPSPHSSYGEQLSRTNLYIRGLSPDTTDKDLVDMCKK